MRSIRINPLKTKGAIGAVLAGTIGLVHAISGPTLSIKTPALHSRTTNNVISGLVSTNIAGGVNYTIVGEDTGATLTGVATLGSVTNRFYQWSIDVALPAGHDMVYVSCSNSFGMDETIDSFFYRVPAPLTLTLGGSGSGTITGLSLGGDPAPSLTMTNLYLGAHYTLTATPDADSVFTGWTGSLTNSHRAITFEMTSNLVLQANFSTTPRLAITSPTPEARTNAIVIAGTTSHNSLGVRYWITNINDKAQTVMSGDAVLSSNATGQVTWSVAATPLPGKNVLLVQSYNSDSTNSAIRRFFYRVTAPLTLSKTGTGHGMLIGSSQYPGDPFPPFSTNLYIGETYRLDAVPGLASYFDGWSGSITSSKNNIFFVMESNLVLQATFTANPFPKVAGVYSGLFADTNGVAEDSAGILRGFVVTGSGIGSGKLMIGGQTYGINGMFDRNGNFKYRVLRPGHKALVVNLVLDIANFSDIMTGTVSDGTFVSQLTAQKASGTGSGAYTIVLPGAADEGSGYLYATNRNGTLLLSGALGDGTPVMASAPVSAEGIAPLYLSLCGRSGLLFGDLVLSSNNLSGTLSWIKSGAFTNTMELVNSTYVASQPFTMPAATLQCAGGDLSAALTFNVAVATNTLVDLGPNNAVSGTIDPKTGILTVQFRTDQGTNVGKAIILQNTTSGAGLFRGTNQTGSILLNLNN